MARVMARMTFLMLGGSRLVVGAAAGLMAIPGVDVAGGMVTGTAAYFAGEPGGQHWPDTILGGDIGKDFSWL